MVLLYFCKFSNTFLRFFFEKMLVTGYPCIFCRQHYSTEDEKMKKRRWPFICATIFLLHWVVESAQAEWNMIKPFKDLLINGAGQNKTVQPSQPLPTARFKDNGDGTLTDGRTGLLWLKDAQCGIFSAQDTINRNSRTWPDARMATKQLADGFCGLKDGSKAGDWRLPSREELLTIAKDVTSKEQWQTDQAFTNLQTFYYWSSTTGDLYQDYAFYVSIVSGMDSYAFQLNSFHILPVRKKK